jgi:hypothetical protein
MDNPTEVIKRNRYFIEGAPDIDHSSRNHVDDLQEYHIPLIRMHHAHLHDPGIAGGLGVSVTPESNAIGVEPGVAVDGRGELIALSADGKADISLIAPGEEDRLTGHPFSLRTEGLAGQTLYVTIQYAEFLRFTQGAGGKLEQTPWLRLQPVDGDGAFEDDGTAIVLAIVEVDDAGIATVRARDSLLPHGRRLMGASTGSLRIRRVIDGNGTASHATAAEFDGLGNGGLHVSVAAATDRIELGHTGGGNFAELAVGADSARFAGALTVQGAMHSQENVQVDGGLVVQGPQRNQGNLQVIGELTIQGNQRNHGKLQVDGTTLLQGNLGIGTIEPEPNTPLHIPNGPDASLETGGFVVLGQTDGVNLSLDSNKIMARNNGQIANLMLQPNGGDLIVHGQQTDESQRFVINDNGNVGIGESNPRESLHVAGNIRLDKGGGLNARFVRVQSLDLTSFSGTDSWNLSASANDFEIIHNTNARMIIDAIGNVGIGIGLPKARLHVSGNIRADNGLEVTGSTRLNGVDTPLGLRGNGFWNIDVDDNGDLRFNANSLTGGSARMLINDDNGNVGIGTLTPAVKLHVKGNRIRLTNSGNESQFIDLRADGSALDLESRGGDLFINNHGLTFTRIRNFVNISSRDFKDQIVDLSAAEALDLLGRLRAVKYHHKDDPSQRQHIGFVAEELPSLLTTPDQKAYKPTDILAILTMVIQSQQARIQDLLEITDTAKAATTTKNMNTP